MRDTSRGTSKGDIEEMRQEIENARNKNHTRGKKTHKNKWFTFKNIIFYVVITMLIAMFLNIQISKSKGEVPSLFGYQIYEVQTGSMIPTLGIGDLFIAKKVNEETQFKVNDIVTFNHDGDVVTHRIIEVIEEEGKVLFRTKGDNPINSPDLDLLEPENIIAIFVNKLF